MDRIIQDLVPHLRPILGGVALFLSASLFAAEPRPVTATPPSAMTGQPLRWDTQANLVEADLKAMGLKDVLTLVSQATGWEIFLEPGIHRSVTTTFKNSPPSKALDHLLGNLSRVLLPPTNTAPRLLVFRTERDKATERIDGNPRRGPKKILPIENELIVQVKPGTNIDALAHWLGAEVVGRLDELNLYRLRFPDQASTETARELLQSREDVASVYDNYPIERDLPQKQSPSAAPLNLRPKAVPDSDRIIIGLIDTVVDPTTPGISDFLLPGISVTGDSAHPGGQPMHGDSMTQAILRSIATMGQGQDGSAARILPVDVYGLNPQSSTFDVAMGTFQAIEAGAMIINLSLGSPAESPFLHQIIQNAHAQGVIFLGAAGNEPVPDPSFPAAYPEVIAVTSGDPTGNISAFANYGNFVDVVAPGMVTVNYADQAYIVGGTSVSTAFASGMAASMKQDQNLTWQQLETAIRQSYPVNPAAVAP